MKIENKEVITTVIASAQLPMYGYVALFIRQDEDGVRVGWREIEEGGHVFVDEEETFSGLKITTLIEEFANIESTVEPTPYEPIYWAVQFGDSEDCEVDTICGTEDGNVDRVVLEEMLDAIDCFLQNTEVTGPFRRMLAM